MKKTLLASPGELTAERRVRQLPVRLDSGVYEELARRSQITGQSMNEIVKEALVSHFRATRVPRAKLREAVQRIAKSDAAILDALKKA